jgi:hypothetical protein
VNENDDQNKAERNINNGDQKKGNKIGNRLSFDFCELRADQLLESTPISFHEDRNKSKIMSNLKVKHKPGN